MASLNMEQFGGRDVSRKGQEWTKRDAIAIPLALIFSTAASSRFASLNPDANSRRCLSSVILPQSLFTND
eukprot:2466845-Amphidinium_carterae.1